MGGKGYCVYGLANKARSADDIEIALRTGSDLALAMDFNHYVCQNTKLPSNVSQAKDVKTYQGDVGDYRGQRIGLPVIQKDNPAEKPGRFAIPSMWGVQTATATPEGVIGVGHLPEALGLKGLKNTSDSRSSTVKLAFGQHAKESIQADVAQGCGTTGRGNMHMWEFAMINQQVDAPLRLTEDETRVFLLMVSTIMTADGGHTLSEMLATAKFAANNALNMDEADKNLVVDFFTHVQNITAPMANDEGKFAHYDLIFNSIGNSVDSDDTVLKLQQAWRNAVSTP